MKAILYTLRRKRVSNVCTQGTLEMEVISAKMNESPLIYESLEELEQVKDGVWKTLACTLEPPVSSYYGEDMFKPAAIPEGLYELERRWSGKFRGDRWFLKDVPFFSGIMIHVGNTAKDTQGCILVGVGDNVNFITNSKIADERIRRQMNRIGQTGCKQYLRVVNEF